MQQLTILNSRDVKKIRELVVKQFGYFPEEDYAFLKGENDKVYMVNKDVARVDLKKLIVDRMGLYFAELRETEVRLSKEGAQLLGREARDNKKELRNVVDLNQREVKAYFAGVDLVKDLGEENKLVLLQFGNDVFGCAKYKGGKIINFMPKIHRGEVIL
ncbi:hypothetical protein HYX11_01215 [Candidatus Woesearchaeota archaeon]|nr:hypothetical protein [Candidatus Woesearchaeota archaeon]